jgi:hypothetical protein
MLISVGSSNDVLLHSPRLRIAAAKEASAGVGGVCCVSRNGTQLALSRGEMLNVLRPSARCVVAPHIGEVGCAVDCNVARPKLLGQQTFAPVAPSGTPQLSSWSD